MKAFSIYNPRRVIHEWTNSVSRDYPDMMHSNCGLSERRKHLKANEPAFHVYCKKCHPFMKDQ